MKKTIKHSLSLALLIISTGATNADFLLGVNPLAINSLSKTAKGIYRTPVNAQDVDITYTESISYLGTGMILEAGNKPGHASIRLLPTLYKGSNKASTAGYSSSVYDLLGFSNAQSKSFVDTNQTPPNNIIINESAIGTAIIFKYTAPTDFKAKSKGMKMTQKILRTLNPWFGIGPMMITFSRLLEAEGRNEFAKDSYTDFYFIIGMGLSIEPHFLVEVFPRNVFISMDLLFSNNLTPGRGSSTNDDNLNISQGGVMFNFGFGYRI